jgi:hypothetical protein
MELKVVSVNGSVQKAIKKAFSLKEINAPVLVNELEDQPVLLVSGKRYTVKETLPEIIGLAQKENLPDRTPFIVEIDRINDSPLEEETLFFFGFQELVKVPASSTIEDVLKSGSFLYANGKRYRFFTTSINNVTQ